MPTRFTAISVDRLLEPGTSKSTEYSVPKPKALPKAMPVRKSNLLERRNSTDTIERKLSCPPIRPALYATPKPIPLADSPSSFSPSPYIINHKRRGPRLLKSFSEQDLPSRMNELDGNKTNGTVEENEVIDSTKNGSVTQPISDSVEGIPPNNGQVGLIREEYSYAANESSSNMGHMNGVPSHEFESNASELKSTIMAMNSLELEKDRTRRAVSSSERDGESDDFFDPQESTSYASNIDSEDNSAAESSGRLAASTPIGEFFDAWEELSSDSGLQSSLRDFEVESREIKLNLAREIEKRKRMEESLNLMQNQWQRMRQQLCLVGLKLPECPLSFQKGEPSSNSDPAEDLCQQVYVSRIVSESVARGIGKAEVEVEKEAQIEAKNSEIARLWDRLHYYEAVNQEMSQRNQEAVEMARHNRKIRKGRQRLIWGSVAAVVTLCTAALVWSYLPAKTESSSTSKLLPLCIMMEITADRQARIVNHKVSSI